MLSIDKNDKGIEVRFQSDLDNIDKACAALGEYLRDGGLDDYVFGFLLITREALLNAVIHGNGRDPDTFVSLRLLWEKDKAVITVADQGPGWNWRDRKVCLPCCEKTSGRGVFIIDRYSDGFFYNEKGNIITMNKKVPQEDVRMSEIRRKGSKATLKPGKDFVASSAEEFKEMIKSLIHDGTTHLVLDCTGMNMIDSIGVGVLVATHNSLAGVGGSLEIVGASEDVYELLTIMCLDKHFSIKPADNGG